MRLATLVVAGLVLLGPGCGHKGALVAPELVRPEPPTDLTASATPDGVKLTWTRPTKYAGGQRMRDLGSFIVERADADATPWKFTRVGTLDLQDQRRYRQEHRLTYTDGKDLVPEREYVYRVSARTIDGYVSPAAGPVTVRIPPP